jgi:hypothetical protein
MTGEPDESIIPLAGIIPADIMDDTPALSVMAGHRAGHPSRHLPLPMAGTLPGHDWKEARTSQAFYRLV